MSTLEAVISELKVSQELGVSALESPEHDLSNARTPSF